MQKICTAILLFTSVILHAQANRDSLQKAKRDSVIEAKMLASAYYPLIKSSKWSGVLPVKDVTEKPDPNQQYKLLMEVVFGMKDSATAKNINTGLSEVGRLINLHIASGIPKKNLDVVVVVHGPALKALYRNDVYKKKFGIDNPNLILVRELMDNGIRFIACGQAMNFLEITKDQLVDNIKISLTAQTVLSNYQLKGYVLYAIPQD